MKNKRGVSALVATVLLILITIAAVGIIWGAVLPLIQKGMKQGTGCTMETTLSIDTSSGYTCYNEEENFVTVFVERPPADFNLVGITLSVSGGGFKKAYEIRGNESVESVYYYNGTDYVNDSLKLPGKGEGLTYKINISYPVDRAEVSPIVKVGNTEVRCSTSAEADVPKCA